MTRTELKRQQALKNHIADYCIFCTELSTILTDSLGKLQAGKVADAKKLLVTALQGLEQITQHKNETTNTKPD